MRSSAHNTLHAATLVVLGDNDRRRARIICCLCKPCQAWQGCQVTANRSPTECGDYFLGAASGSFMPTLQFIFKVMSSPWQLEHMGITLGRVHDMPPDEHRAFVASEQEWASIIVELAFQLVMHRMKRLLWHWAGGYGMFALLLGGASCQEKCLRQMESIFDTWQAAMAQGRDKELQTKLDRSFMNWEVVKHMYRLAKNTGFKECSPAMQAMCEDMFKGLGQTKVLEDGMGQFRRAEGKESENKFFTMAHMWVTPIKAHILDKVHRYTDIDPSSVALGQQDPSFLPKGMFKPRHTGTSVNMKDIMSKQPKTNWNTFSAQSSVSVYADMSVLREAHASNGWLHIKNVWLCRLLKPGAMYKKAGD